tara:strand:+ start:527 stop:703 length:177 start_codon:yes stop_codon:yes gene_type:complete
MNIYLNIRLTLFSHTIKLPVMANIKDVAPVNTILCLNLVSLGVAKGLNKIANIPATNI